MDMLNEFKQFALRGNVLDMAVGIVIGVAFGAIVSSLVDDIIMPPLGLVLGGMDFSELFVTLSGSGDYNTIAQAKEAGAVTWNLGLFINAVLKFLIVAVALFLLVQAFNRLRRKQDVAVDAPDAPVTPSRSELLLEEIRDLLSSRSRS
jgi:large conductance mechanosensitive channel